MKSFSLFVAGLLISGLILCPYEARGETAVADIFYNQALKNDPTDLEKAAQLYASAIAEFDKTGTRDDRYATCLSNLALIELKGNDLKGAEGHIKRSLDSSENHQVMAKNYQMMGDIKLKQDKLTEADGAYSGVLEIYTKYGDPNHQQAAVLEKLASVYERMGKTTEANALRVKATDIATFQVTDSGAQRCYRQGTKALIANDYPSAINQFEHALQLQPDFKAAKMNLAISYQHEALEHQHKSEYAVAESNYLLALPAMEAAFGPKHAYTCTVLQGLCETLEAENKFDDAEKYASRWVSTERETTKAGQPMVNALRSYSRILKANKKTDQATAIDKELSGDEEKDKKKIDFSSYQESAKKNLDFSSHQKNDKKNLDLSSYVDQANAEIRVGNADKAFESFQKALAQFEQKGEQDIQYCTCLNSMAAVALQQYKMSLAEDYANKSKSVIAAMKAEPSHLMPVDQRTVDALESKTHMILADIKSAQGQNDQAETEYKLAIAAVGSDDDLLPGKVVAVKKLAKFYDKIGKSAESEALKKELPILIVRAEPAVDTSESSAIEVEKVNQDIRDEQAKKLESKGNLADVQNAQPGNDRVPTDIRVRANNNFSAAMQELEKQDYSKAIDLFKATLADDPKSAAARVELTLSYYNLGTEQQRQGKYAEAEAKYRNALPLIQDIFGAHDEKTCLVWQGLTETLVAQDRLADAEQTASKWARTEIELHFWTRPAVRALTAYSQILRKENKTSQADVIDAEIAEDRQMTAARSGLNQ